MYIYKCLFFRTNSGTNPTKMTAIYTSYIHKEEVDDTDLTLICLAFEEITFAHKTISYTVTYIS